MKKRIHVQIALVGDSPTPVYQGIVHMQPNQVVLVCSGRSEETAKNIRKQLPSYSDANILIYEASDTDINRMYDTFELIEKALPKGITISLNITSGMKLWSVIANNVFRRKRRSCHTFFIGQNGTFFDLKNKTTKGKVEFDMDAQFKILGHHLDEYTTLTEYDGQDDVSFHQILNMVFDKGYKQAFKDITLEFVDQYKQKYKTNEVFAHPFSVSKDGNVLSWEPDTNSFDYVIAGKSGRFCSPHISHLVLKTGWFEYNVAKMIGQIYGPENVHLNCIFRSAKNTTKNEIDIIVNTGSKLIFVECKTQIYNITDIDKFRSAVRNYGGLGSKALFVTNWEMFPDGQEKCNELRITTFFTSDMRYKKQDERINALRDVLEKLNKDWNV